MDEVTLYKCCAHCNEYTCKEYLLDTHLQPCYGGCPREVSFDPVFDTDDCPFDGAQRITSTSASPGADPYAINLLACGHRVTCFGPGERNVVLGERR